MLARLIYKIIYRLFFNWEFVLINYIFISISIFSYLISSVTCPSMNLRFSISFSSIAYFLKHKKILYVFHLTLFKTNLYMIIKLMTLTFLISRLTMVFGTGTMDLFWWRLLVMLLSLSRKFEKPSFLQSHLFVFRHPKFPEIS